jgi:hypothetical protein
LARISLRKTQVKFRNKKITGILIYKITTNQVAVDDVRELEA